MSHKGILSSAFNMSLGYIPVIISIVLCEFITQDTAIYIGTGIGLLYSYYSMHRKGVRIPNFILYISTAILVLLTIAALIPGDYVPPGALPLTVEVSIQLLPEEEGGLFQASVCPRCRISHCICTHRTNIRDIAFYCDQSGNVFCTPSGRSGKVDHIQLSSSHHFCFSHHLQSNQYSLLQ